MSNIAEHKPKKRRFSIGTVVKSTNETIDNVLSKFVVQVRYYSDTYTCTSDYLIVKERHI